MRRLAKSLLCVVRKRGLCPRRVQKLRGDDVCGVGSPVAMGITAGGGLPHHCGEQLGHGLKEAHECILEIIARSFVLMCCSYLLTFFFF